MNNILDRYVSIGNEGRVLRLGPVETEQLSEEVDALAAENNALKAKYDALVKAVVIYRAVCPADDDATTAFWAASESLNEVLKP